MKAQRRHSIWAVALLSIFLVSDAVAQEGQIGGKKTEKPAQATVASGEVVAGKLLPRRRPPWRSPSAFEERLEVSLPVKDPLVRYVFTNHGGTLRHAVMLEKKFTREAVDAKPGVPKTRTEAGQIDLISTWDANWLPYRLRFDEIKFGKRVAGEAVKYEERFGTVIRVIRASTSGEMLDPQTLSDKDDTGWAIDGLVKAGDWVEIQGIPAWAGKKILITSIDESGQIKLKEKVEGIKQAFSYRIMRQGLFNTLFQQDPRFTRVSKDVGLPLVYVWPNPHTDRSPIFIEKRYDAGKKDYELSLTVAIRNFADLTVKIRPTFSISGWQHPGEASGGSFVRPTNIYAASCFTGQTLEREEFPSLVPDVEEGKRETVIAFPQSEASWISIDTVYFLNALVSKSSHIAECSLIGSLIQVGTSGASRLNFRQVSLKPAASACTPPWLKLKGHMSCEAARKELDYDPATSSRRLKAQLQVQRNIHQGDKAKHKAKQKKLNEAYNALKASETKDGTERFRFAIYTGPKNPEILKASGDDLKEAMDYGMLGWIAELLHQLLRTFFDLFHSWALAIIMLTILVKILLLPLTNKSFRAMQKMQKLKPELDELKKKHKGNRDAMNKAMFALYKRHKVNPLGGCLPMLLQMPIWIALYQTIGGAVELFHTPLGLWIDDLSAQDPYYILPVIMGLLMIVQNQISGSTATMEGMQAKIMKWGMPIMFTVFMLFLPAGLVLYILVNTTLTIFQNIYIRRRLA